MILTAHQPTFLPWTGLFHKIAQADQFVFFDDVQFEYHEYGNRNRIMTANGPLMITIPIEKQGHMSRPWHEIRIANRQWVEKMIKTLSMAYGKAPYFADYMPKLAELLRVEHEFLADLNVSLTSWLLEELGIPRPIMRASKLGFVGKGSDLVLDMCKKLGAEKYWFGAGGLDYADVEAFTAAGVEVAFQQFTPPAYRRIHFKQPFEPGLSVIDLLMTCGPYSLGIILKQGEDNAPR